MLAAISLSACSAVQPEGYTERASRLCKNEPILGYEEGVKTTLSVSQDNLKVNAGLEGSVYQRYTDKLANYDAKAEQVYRVTRTACIGYMACRLRIEDTTKEDPGVPCKPYFTDYSAAERDVRGLLQEVQATGEKVRELAAKSGAEAKPIPALVAAAPGEEVVGFSGFKLSAPQWTVAAAPYLQEQGISIGELKPKGSRLVLVSTDGLYEGRAVRPTYSQNLLTLVDSGNETTSFELVLARPARTVALTRPSLWAATNSGVTHPAWTARAFDEANREIAVTSEGLTRSFDTVPAQTYTLVATGFSGIKKIRVESDFRLDGKPFAGFGSMLIERLSTTPFAPPKTSFAVSPTASE